MIPLLFASIWLTAVSLDNSPRHALEPESAFEGTWTLVSANDDGDEVVKESTIVVKRINRFAPGPWPGQPEATWSWDETRGKKLIHWNVTRTAARPYHRVVITKKDGRRMGSRRHYPGENGIYNLSGNILTFCFIREGDPLPRDLERGLGRFIEVYRRVRPGEELGKPDAQKRAEGPPLKVRILDPDWEAMLGTWELVSLNRDGKPVPPEARGPRDIRDGTRLVVERLSCRLIEKTASGKLNEDRTIVTLFRSTPARPAPVIERERQIIAKVEMEKLPDGRMRRVKQMLYVPQRGIYRVAGDTLTIVFPSHVQNPPIPTKDQPLPSGLEPGPGRDVEVYRRVR
jgi:hypothetical protein